MKKYRYEIIQIMLSVILVVIAVIFACLFPKRKLEHDNSAALFASGFNGETLTIPGLTNLCFDADEIKQDVLFSNPSGNKADMLITLSAGDHMIYESGLIYPGECIKEIEINKEFSKGTYDCIIEYQFYSNGVKLNGLRNKCTLEVR